MFKNLTAYVDKLLHDGGPSAARFINIGVFAVLSIAMLKLTWTNKDEPGLYYWACFFTLAAYGMGTQNWSKYLDIIKAKVGGNAEAKSEVAK